MSNSSDEYPELATNTRWRSAMVAARNAANMSQAALGDKVGLSQAMISKIESGASGSSDRVKLISKILGIELPEHYIDESEREWIRIWRAFRAKSEVGAMAARALVEKLYSELENQESATSEKKTK